MDRSWKYINLHRHINLVIGTEAALFPKKEYIKAIFLAVQGYIIIDCVPTDAGAFSVTVPALIAGVPAFTTIPGVTAIPAFLASLLLQASLQLLASL